MHGWRKREGRQNILRGKGIDARFAADQGDIIETLVFAEYA